MHPHWACASVKMYCCRNWVGRNEFLETSSTRHENGTKLSRRSSRRGRKGLSAHPLREVLRSVFVDDLQAGFETSRRSDVGSDVCYRGVSQYETHRHSSPCSPGSTLPCKQDDVRLLIWRNSGNCKLGSSCELRTAAVQRAALPRVQLLVALVLTRERIVSARSPFRVQKWNWSCQDMAVLPSSTSRHTPLLVYSPTC